MRFLSIKSMHKSAFNKNICKRIIGNNSFSKYRSFCSSSKGLAEGYVPSAVESIKVNDDYFCAPVSKEKPFSMILPPPNITGDLHLGHALTATIQDVIVRWHRLNGRQTSWIPGLDHAGIATQVIVEKKLMKEKGLSRHDIGRELFEQEVWKWKQAKSEIIEQQLRRLGVCLDWHKLLFTMDESQSIAVRKAFIKLFKSGLIYRGDYLVNWSCVLQSAISDIEVDHIQIKGPTEIDVPGYDKPVQFGVLTNFAYKLHEAGEEEVVVATTRPETMWGDVAVAVNPRDERYASLIGRNLWHPLRKETIPIISDDFVDPSFGTGAVKITPAHDPTDFDVSKRHALKPLSVISTRGEMEFCADMTGMKRFEARKRVLQELESLGLFRGSQPHEMTVPICSRSKDVVEFLVKPQWFLKCDDMAQKAALAVKNGDLRIQPEHFEKTWLNWLENIRDWCISRQLWWGHRIPAFECSVKGDPDRKCWVAAEGPEDAILKAQKHLSAPEKDLEVSQDPDVLDTWFSSSLLPFSSLGWPQKDPSQELFPLTLMETGHDILFFWVARMAMLGKQLTGKIPFQNILLHGIICDSQGRKMSKSLGNVIAPEQIINGVTLKGLQEVSINSHASGVLSKDELERALQDQRKTFPEGIPECGAEALRFSLCCHNVKSHFITFDVHECKTNKFFGNKIWQAVKFSNKWTDEVANAQNCDNLEISALSLMDRWILSRLEFMVSSIKDSMNNYEFHAATSALKNFIYYEFCDVYLETTKRGLQRTTSLTANGHVFTLSFCLSESLRYLSPFMPKLSQNLHQNLQVHPLIQKQVPSHSKWRNPELEKTVEKALDVTVGIRRLKKLFNVSRKHKPEVYLPNNSVCEEFLPIIEDLSASHSVQFTEEDLTTNKAFVFDKVAGTIVFLRLPEELRQTFEADLKKMVKKLGKLQEDLEKFKLKTLAPQYLEKASDNLKESNNKKIAEMEEKISRIQYLQSFSSS